MAGPDLGVVHDDPNGRRPVALSPHWVSAAGPRGVRRTGLRHAPPPRRAGGSLRIAPHVAEGKQLLSAAAGFTHHLSRAQHVAFNSYFW
jgi:hypothetical protein